MMATSTILKTISIDTKKKGEDFVKALQDSSAFEVKISDIKKPLNNKKAKEFIDTFAVKYE